MNFLNPIPWWARLLAVSGLCVALWGWGYIKGLNVGEEKLDAYRLEVATAAAKQDAHTSVVIQQQKRITEDTANDYETALKLINDYYVGRMRKQSASVGNVPALPAAPQRVDEVPADSLPLAQQCAGTTKQLEALQKWVNDQFTASAPK